MEIIEMLAVLKDAQGRYRTESLFKETHRGGLKYPPLYSLRPGPTSGLISLHDKYIELNDPTEYKVAVQLFGNWEHWEKVSTRSWFIPYLESWRVELATKRRSEALANITTFASQKDGLGFGANKIIMEESDKYLAPPKSPVGRPKKPFEPEVVDTVATDADAKRLGIL